MTANDTSKILIVTIFNLWSRDDSNPSLDRTINLLIPIDPKVGKNDSPRVLL